MKSRRTFIVFTCSIHLFTINLFPCLIVTSSTFMFCQFDLLLFLLLLISFKKIHESRWFVLGVGWTPNGIMSVGCQRMLPEYVQSSEHTVCACLQLIVNNKFSGSVCRLPLGNQPASRACTVFEHHPGPLHAD